MSRRQPLYAVIVRRMGFRAAFKVTEFVMAWALCEAELGRAPVNVEEYARWWNEGRAAAGRSDLVSLATAYRHQQSFRDCFEAEGFETPSQLFEALGITPGQFGVETLREGVLA